MAAPRERPAPAGAGLAEAAALAGGFLAIYLLTLSPNLSAAHDSISLLIHVESGRSSFHPHHLLFQPLAAAWLGTLRALGMRGDAALLVAALNALFGAGTLAGVLWTLRQRLALERTRALGATALCGFSFGLWFYSTCVEVYVVPLFFLVAALALLLAPRPSLATGLAAGLAHGLAVLFHQVHVLFVLVPLLLVLGRRDRWPSIRRAAFGYAAALLPTIALPYGLVALAAGLRTPGELWHWLTLYAQSGQFWSPPSLLTLPRMAVGFARSVFGLHFGFALPGGPETLQRTFPANWLVDEAFLVRELSAGAAWTLTGLTLLLLGGLGLWVFAALRAPAPTDSPRREAARLLLGWALVYAAFFAFWEPTNLEFWIPPSVALWMWLVVRSASARGLAGRALLPALVALGLLVVNLAGSVRFLTDAENDYHARKAGALASLSGPDDLIVIGRVWLLQTHLRRAERTRVLALTTLARDAADPGAFVGAVRRRIDQALAAGRRVVVSDEAVAPEPPTLRGAPALEHLPEVWAAYTADWIAQPSATGEIRVIEPPAATPGRSSAAGGRTPR